MYASFRQAELVGKRFLCVREKNSLRPNSRSSRVSNPLDYQWKVGVIRACSEKDIHHPELKVRDWSSVAFNSKHWLSLNLALLVVDLIDRLTVHQMFRHLLYVTLSCFLKQRKIASRSFYFLENRLHLVLYKM